MNTVQYNYVLLHVCYTVLLVYNIGYTTNIRAHSKRKICDHSDSAIAGARINGSVCNGNIYTVKRVLSNSIYSYDSVHKYGKTCSAKKNGGQNQKASKFPHPTSVKQLADIRVVEWDKISLEIIQILYEFIQSKH